MRTRIAIVVAVLFLAGSAHHADAQWRVSRSTNPLDDSTTVAALLDAVQGTGGLFREEPVRLIARCRSNRTEAYIVWHDFLGLDDQRVTYRFPPAAAQTESWGLSTDNDSTFVRRAIPFLRIAAESARLVVQTVPYGEAPVTAIFNLAGAENALAQIAETCEWTLDREQARRERQQRERTRQERQQRELAAAQAAERAAEQERQEEERRERAEQARREQERQAERERFLVGILNVPITTGLTGPIAAGAVGGVAGLRTANGYARMSFPTASASQLSRARRSGGYEIVCASADLSGDEIELRDCTLSP